MKQIILLALFAFSAIWADSLDDYIAAMQFETAKSKASEFPLAMQEYQKLQEACFVETDKICTWRYAGFSMPNTNNFQYDELPNGIQAVNYEDLFACPAGSRWQLMAKVVKKKLVWEYAMPDSKGCLQIVPKFAKSFGKAKKVKLVDFEPEEASSDEAENVQDTEHMGTIAVDFIRTESYFDVKNTGTRTSENIVNLISVMLDGLNNFANSKYNGQAVEGKLTVKLVIDSDGHVSSATAVSSTIRNPSFESDIANEIGRWFFGMMGENETILYVVFRFTT